MIRLKNYVKNTFKMFNFDIDSFELKKKKEREKELEYLENENMYYLPKH